MGTLFVLTAVVALQVPFFTCHSDCQSACLPLWVLAAHHCHEVEAPPHTGCACHGHGHGHGQENEDAEAPQKTDAPEEHAPGDHDLLFQQGVPGTTSPSLAILPPVVIHCEVAADSVGASWPSRIEGTTAPPGDAGPPGCLGSVRLLL